MLHQITSFDSYLNKSSTNISNFNEKLKTMMSDDNEFVIKVKEFIRCISRKEMYFTGIGKNQPIAEKTANMLRSLGFVAHYFDCVNAMHGDLGVLKNDAVIVAISKSGNTSELVHMLRYVKDNFAYVKTFGISLNNSKNSFDQFTENSLHLPEIDELDEWNKVPTTSNIAFQIFFDIISMIASDDKKLSIEQFVKSHPGGTIGETKIKIV